MYFEWNPDVISPRILYSHTKMKNALLLVAAFAVVSLVACTNAATDGTSSVDSTAVAPVETIETEVVETAEVDTTAVVTTEEVAQ
jgi:hypothetical protein